MKSRTLLRPFRNFVSLLVIGIFMLPGSMLAQPVNDLCGAAITVSSFSSCVNTTGTLVASTYTAVAGACGSSRNDVWYRFTAQSTGPTITLTTAVANPRFQVYSGSCGTPTSVFCSTSGSQQVTGLSIGTVYLVRVYSNTNASGTFDMCIVDAPSNNTCTNAVVLTSGTTCSNTAGNVYAATNSAPTISAPDCAASVSYDVWYRFVAQTTNPTISLSSIGSAFTNASIQLLSNNCGGTYTSLFCGGSTLATDYLTPGTTYYIRVYSSGGTPPPTNLNAGFNICITDPVTPAPFNDECVNAINLPIWNTCNNIPGSIAGATPSSTPLSGSCTGPNAYDIWYKFTAVNNTATISLSSIGGNFLTPQLEIFSGSCGSLTSISCGVSPLAAVGLTAGQTYYIRVYSTTAPAPNGNARFNICATTTNAPLRYGNSYVNISKKTSGGVVEPGDTLEIRFTVNHTSGTMYAMRYVDNTPTNTTMLAGAGNFIRIITNEGLVYKQYTTGGGDDAAMYNASPGAGEYNVRLNLGFGSSSPGVPVNTTATESASATGTMNSGSDRPRGGGGMLFAAAYRVVVSGATGDTITLNPAQFIYQTSPGGSDITLTASSFKILISEPLSLCNNSIGVNIASETGGTFGSGNTLNRSYDLANPISGYTFVSDVNAYIGVNDGRYAIVKNLSPRSGTQRNARRQNTCNTPTVLANSDPFNCNNRMFNGFWFVDGDHSGTTNAIGNTPPASGTSAGYMLMVNADYVASEVYRQTINNLCPNTYYEFSAWIRNICPNCGIDSAGVSYYGPGVLPNLTFSLNNVDYYNSGEVDTSGWQKKGFVFRTGLTQTSAVFSIRNNSQGGGGNDWALDDIAVATCLPTMSYSPTINPVICENNAITLEDTISSFFKNYTTYKWQRSVNGGASWTDITGVTTLPDTNYYITTYTIPPGNATLADSGDLYRVVVATTVANLSDPNCNISEGTTITLSVIDCTPLLGVEFLQVSGKLFGEKAQINWKSSREKEAYRYVVEKSTDLAQFLPVDTIAGHNNPAAESNSYQYTDPQPLTGRTWYRVRMIAANGSSRYSKVVELSRNSANLQFGPVINPFDEVLSFTLQSPGNRLVSVDLVDMTGKTVCRKAFQLSGGSNTLQLLNTGHLPSGVYTLLVRDEAGSLVHRVVKVK